MRRVSLWLLSTIAIVVLLFSYRTSTGSSASATTVAVAPAPATSSQSTSPGTSAGTTSGAAPNAAASSATTTYTGSTAQTRWGDVQVTITVTGGKITAVDVPVYPNGNRRDQEINAYAVPELKQETLAAQNADIDTISGATVTSNGYLESLQAALDAAHLS